MAGAKHQRDPQPLDHQAEITFVVLAGVLLVLAWAAMLGQAVSGAVFGGGWVPPASNELFSVVAGLLSGHPGQGLLAAQQAKMPGPFAVYGCVAIAELLAVVLAVGASVIVVRYRRPGDARRGMATHREAAQVLGVRRLRTARAVIRPDLADLSSERAGGEGEIPIAVVPTEPGVEL